MFEQNPNKQKTMGKNIELLREGVDQNPCAQLNNWEDSSPGWDEGICSSSYCYGNSQEKFSRTVLE